MRSFIHFTLCVFVLLVSSPQFAKSVQPPLAPAAPGGQQSAGTSQVQLQGMTQTSRQGSFPSQSCIRYSTEDHCQVFIPNCDVDSVHETIHAALAPQGGQHQHHNQQNHAPRRHNLGENGHGQRHQINSQSAGYTPPVPSVPCQSPSASTVFYCYQTPAKPCTPQQGQSGSSSSASANGNSGSSSSQGTNENSRVAGARGQDGNANNSGTQQCCKPCKEGETNNNGVVSKTGNGDKPKVGGTQEGSSGAAAAASNNFDAKPNSASILRLSVASFVPLIAAGTYMLL